jgi:ABC-type phosphate transport system permease subunit
MKIQREPVMSEAALAWGYRGIWALCIAVYLVVFVGGVQAGGSDLLTIGRAIGFTLATALVGKLALSVLAQAKQPLSATEDGTVGSLVDLTSSPNISEPEDEAEAA